MGRREGKGKVKGREGGRGKGREGEGGKGKGGGKGGKGRGRTPPHCFLDKSNPDHILYHLFLDGKTELKYDSRRRRHEFTFAQKINRTLGRLQFHYPIRLLYKDCYTDM